MTKIPSILRNYQSDLLMEWLSCQKASGPRGQVVPDGEVREQSRRFLSLLQEATQAGEISHINTGTWKPVLHFLQDLSENRAKQGCTSTETATFVFSLKQPLFARLRAEYESDPDALAGETWAATLLLDQLGLYTIEMHQKRREEIILRQQQDMIELSTPVVQLWHGILALPLIGTLDSARTQVVMETLLERIVETGSSIAIIDITGVPTVDTLVAQHLMKTVAAARLMGADCIISGIRPQIAQTIVHLGVALGDVTTKASLADAFALALERRRLAVAEARA